MKQEMVVYAKYLRVLNDIRAVVVDVTQEITNQASTNPPIREEKWKLFDGVYLEYNKDQQLVVWSYGPGGKHCMGPHYPTAEAYPIRIFLDRLLFTLDVNKLKPAPLGWMPRDTTLDSIRKIRKEYLETVFQLKKVGRRMAEVLVNNDQNLPTCLIRGKQPRESYAILYLNDGSGGTCPEEIQLVRLCGERATEDADNYEYFIRVMLCQ